MAAGRHGDLRAYAETERKLATVAELQGHWERALAAREAAAQAFAASKLPAEAAAERLSAAAHLRSAGRYRTALELLVHRNAKKPRRPGAPICTRASWAWKAMSARVWGRCRMAWRWCKRGLALALEHNLAECGRRDLPAASRLPGACRGLCRRQGDLPDRVRLLPGQRHPRHRPALRRLSDGGAAPDW